MARGLSDNQIKILQIIERMPDGGNSALLVKRKIREQMYPRLFADGIKITDQNRYDALKARTTIYKAINRLIKRGLLAESRQVTRKEYYMDELVSTKEETCIYITESGKKIINQ